MPPLSSGRIQLFNKQEYNSFYEFPSFSPQEQDRFFAFTKADAHLMEEFSSDRDKIYFLLCLGYFRSTLCFVNFTPRNIKCDWDYIYQKYLFDKKIYKRLPHPRQRIRIQNKILEHEGFIRWSNRTQEMTLEALMKMVQRHPKPKPLTKALLDYLASKKVALPPYSALQRIISKTLVLEKKRLSEICKKFVEAKTKKIIKELLKSKNSFSSLEQIKNDVKDFSFTEGRKEMERHKNLKPLFKSSIKALEQAQLPKKTIEFYGSLVNFYGIYMLKRMPINQVYLYLLCYAFTRYQKVNDNLVQFFKYYASQFHERSKKYSKNKIDELVSSMDEGLRQTAHVLELFTSNPDKEFVKRKEAFSLLPQKEMKKVASFLLGRESRKYSLYWHSVDSLKHQIALNLRPIFLAIDFTTVKSNEFQEMISQMNEFLGKTIDGQTLKSLLPKSHRDYLLDESGDIIKPRFEFFFYRKVARSIETQKVTLTYSHRYKALSEELIDERIWEKEKGSILKSLGYSKLIDPIDQILDEHEKTLDSLLLKVNQRLKNGENKHIKLKQEGSLIKWSLPYQKRPTLINNPFFLQLPQIGIVDILYFVDKQCDFLKQFSAIQSHSTKDPRNNQNLIAAILGNAVRMGSYKMADASSLNLWEVLTTEKTYLRLETLHNAIDAINNATSKLSIFPYWNIDDKLHSSLDGTKIGTKLETLKSRYSLKYYGLGKGVSSYNHITNHVPINARIISPNEHESHFIFPVVYNNTSEIMPTRHSGDGHSYNRTGFTLFDTIDHDYFPCLPGIQKRPLYCFSPMENYCDLIIKPSQKVKRRLIVEMWPRVIHVIASVLQNETDISPIISKLASHKYYSKTKDALWEYEGILRSIYILNYVDDISLRQSVRSALNRGEAYHQLYKAISYVNGGKFRGKSEMEIEIWSECTRLIASAIIYYNSYILSLLLDQSENQEQRDFVTKLSPAAWSHIHLLGKYELKPTGVLEIEEWVQKMEINPSKFKI